MYDENYNFIPTDGNDYRMISESKIDRLVEEIEEKETEIELPEDIYGDEYDAVVTGEIDL